MAVAQNPQLPPITITTASNAAKSAGATVKVEDDEKSARVAKAVEAACRSPISKVSKRAMPLIRQTWLLGPNQ